MSQQLCCTFLFQQGAIGVLFWFVSLALFNYAKITAINTEIEINIDVHLNICKPHFEFICFDLLSSSHTINDDFQI